MTVTGLTMRFAKAAVASDNKRRFFITIDFAIDFPMASIGMDDGVLLLRLSIYQATRCFDDVGRDK